MVSSATYAKKTEALIHKLELVDNRDQTHHFQHCIFTWTSDLFQDKLDKTLYINMQDPSHQMEWKIQYKSIRYESIYIIS